MQRPDYSRWPDLDEILRRYREVVAKEQAVTAPQAPAPVAAPASTTPPTPAAEPQAPVELRRRVKLPGCTRPHLGIGNRVGVEDAGTGRPLLEGALVRVEWLPGAGWRLWLRIPPDGPRGAAIEAAYDAAPAEGVWVGPFGRRARLWALVDPATPAPPEEAKAG